MYIILDNRQQTLKEDIKSYNHKNNAGLVEIINYNSTDLCKYCHSTLQKLNFLFCQLM